LEEGKNAKSMEDYQKASDSLLKALEQGGGSKKRSVKRSSKKRSTKKRSTKKRSSKKRSTKKRNVQ